MKENWERSNSYGELNWVGVRPGHEGSEQGGLQTERGFSARRATKVHARWRTGLVTVWNGPWGLEIVCEHNWKSKFFTRGGLGGCNEGREHKEGGGLRAMGDRSRITEHVGNWAETSLEEQSVAAKILSSSVPTEQAVRIQPIDTSPPHSSSSLPLIESSSVRLPVLSSPCLLRPLLLIPSDCFRAQACFSFDYWVLSSQATS